MNLNDLATMVHEQAKRSGFYANGLDYPERIACIHEELSELFHAYRKGTLTDLCNKRGLPLTNEAEELADIVIRVLDLAAVQGVDIDRSVMLKHEYNATRPHLHGDARAPGEEG